MSYILCLSLSFSFDPETELGEMLKRADTDRDGVLNPDEFYAIITQKN